MVGIAAAILRQNPNDGSERAQAEQAYRLKADAYARALKQTNDPATHARAKAELDEAAKTMGKYKMQPVK